MLKVRITGIQYDTDGEDFALPQEFVLEVEDNEDVEEVLSEYITEQTGFCHGGFHYETLN